MGKIQELPKSSSRLLTSTQIITSVYCVVKELIENSLDSGAKNVEVKLEEYGLEKIEVKDNGCGIDKNDITFVAKSHFTSKISSYSDLEKVLTYGFRGEALGAVCAVADLVITTKSSEESIGSVSNFGHDGQVISTKPCPCVQGTTVAVLNLFKNIPVRRQFYRSDKNKKEELRKIEDLLMSYSCIQHDIRFALYHNRNLIWQKSAVSSSKDALIQVLGNSVMDHMKFIDYFDEQTQRKIELYLPKLDAPVACGYSNSSKCLTAVNKRPVRIKAIDKLLKEYYNKSIQNCSKARYPVCFISFTVPLVEVDVNVEPNKTSVMLHHSEEILTQFSELLKNFYTCNTVTENNLNINNTLNKTPELSKEKPLNASDFLTSLKTNCEIKAQQSKLSFITDCVKIASSRQDDNSLQKKDINRTTDNSMQKKDISRIGDLSEPCRKKLKTNFKASSKDINNHIATLKEFFTSADNTNNTNLCDSLSSVPRVTVQRTSSVESGISTSAALKDCFAKEGQEDNNPNTNLSNSFSSVPTFTIQRTSGVENESNISEINDSLSKINNVNCDRVTTFAVSSNLCDKSDDNSFISVQRSNVLGTSLQFQKDFNDIGINKSLSSVNDTSSDRVTLPVSTNLNADKCQTTICNEESSNSAINSSVLYMKGNESAQKNSAISNSGENADLWSRGVHPSGDIVQPVAILQPKTITTPDSIKKQTSNTENCNKKSPKKSPNDQANFSFERKLTAFDIFCRNNRLEVAAENPEYSNHQIAQILTDRWSRLSPEEKAVYKNMLDKDYRKDIKKKERLGRTITQNLSQAKNEKPISKKPKKKQFRPKSKVRSLKSSTEEIRSSFLNKSSLKQHAEDLDIINCLAPGIWVCAKADKLLLLNTFRLQESIIYHRLLETYQFDTETLEAPVYIPASHVGQDALATLINMKSNNDGSFCKYLNPNGFDIRLITDDSNETAVELLGITKVIAFYGISDLEEILLLIKEKGFSAKLSDCRPGKVVLYLQSEANRMCRKSPACQRIQDVKDLLFQKESLLPDCNMCIHHKPIFHEIWHSARKDNCVE